MEFISMFWQWLTLETPATNPWILLIAIIAGFTLACIPAIWKQTRLFATYIHEAGHALVAILTGRRVTRIRLEADTSGTTEHVGTRGLGMLLTAFAGYPAPALAGWGIAVALFASRPNWVIAGFAALALLLLLVQHSLRGLAVTLIIGLSMWGLYSINSIISSIMLSIVAGYLIAASPRTIIELHNIRSRAKKMGMHPAETHSDADSLTAQTGIPAPIWEFLFLAVSGWTIYSIIETFIHHI